MKVLRELSLLQRIRLRLAVLGVAAIALGPSTARADGCIVRGEHVILENVIGHPSDLRGIDLKGTPARARIPPASHELATVTVDGAIAFKGRRGNIWYTIQRPLTIAHGMVMLKVGAQIVEARGGASRVIGSAVIRADDVFPGEDKDPEETIRALRIPCAALTLDQLADRENDGEVDVSNSGGDGTWWLQRKSARTAVLHAEPTADAPTVTLATTVEGQQFSFERIAEDGSWMRVTRSGSGVRAIGWIRRADLEEGDRPAGISGLCSGHGPGLSGRGWGGKPPSTLYKGPARLRVGAKIDFNGWSATVKRPEGFHIWVYESNGRKFVEVTGIPGVAMRGPSGASISLEDVTEYSQSIEP
jgi:hypothetical protein